MKFISNASYIMPTRPGQDKSTLCRQPAMATTCVCSLVAQLSLRTEGLGLEEEEESGEGGEENVGERDLHFQQTPQAHDGSTGDL